MEPSRWNLIGKKDSLLLGADGPLYEINQMIMNGALISEIRNFLLRVGDENRFFPLALDRGIVRGKN